MAVKLQTADIGTLSMKYECHRFLSDGTAVEKR